ncbi:MAG: aldo/keto reductase [Gemmatimonadaceae bacterium]|nr:aldo/keto reductase [Gemmatimonadaceae bacterium]
MHVPSRPLNNGAAVSRLIKGGWQLAGGHGSIERRAAIDDMIAFADAGITAFDCADIYTGVEAMIGEFLREWREQHGTAGPVRVHTKCVPDRDALATLTRADITRLIDRSLTRLGVEQLDLVQFHWWDYTHPRWLDAAVWLQELATAGKIAGVGLTNFDTARLQAMHDAGVTIVSHQVQISLLDRRALASMATWCQQHQVALFSYGTLAGGFFHERWLNAPEPQEPQENRSLTKYKLIINEFGGWEAFQSLLQTLHTIAQTHHTTIGAVAIRSILDEPAVTSVIVGARHARHLPHTLAALSIELSAADREAIQAHLHSAKGPTGEVYALERDPQGVHAGIMKYNLNQSS